jgi:hypothetical protein
VVNEEVLHCVDGCAHPPHDRVAVAGVADGERQNVAQLPGAVIAEQQKPGVDGGRNGSGEGTGTGDQFKALGELVLAGGGGRRWPLPHQHDGPGRVVGRREDAGHVAAGPIEVRLHNMEHKCPGDGGIEGISAAFQDRLG